MPAGRHLEIRGTVQGVGFRPWVWQLARRHALTGRVRNDANGVVVDAFGDEDDLIAFADDLHRDAPPAARVVSIDARAIPFERVASFEIVRSENAPGRRVSIPPDLATCDDCLDDVFDPRNRRHLYPFTNCTNCGPRYTIVRGVPYDRERTTMAAFAMCPACRAEYDDPNDRRFHAQPIACPACGPKVWATQPNGREIQTDDAIGFAARSLRAQFIVALKGLGGFHLACDATSSIAVVRLRDRKRREAKPLAVMVRDLSEAEELAELSAEERALLTSAERPIVLLHRRANANLAPEIAFDSPLVGLFLPYTPLHHILLRACGMPLVMTSGNVADEPMVTTNAQALAQLGGIADVFLLHDREIETRADDSVARVIAGAPAVLRRGRGFVPRGVDVPRAFAEPVLAVGAHLKNAICIGSGSAAFLGPHVGDLETVETLRSFEASVVQMKQLVGCDPKVVAHDLHPDYYSTRYAETLAGVRLVGVQHHHAHVVSVMAEHALEGQVVGIAYDGTGHGTDGTSWGGEIFVASVEDYERFATFRALPLAGGDQAIRQPWRIALAMLDDAFDGVPPLHALPLFRPIPRRAVHSIRRMIARGFQAPRARGVGRWFDAFAALILARPDARFEGELAMAWNDVADPDERGRYEIVVRDGVTPWEIDPRPMVQQAVFDLLHGLSAATISARFHNTLAAVTIEVARAAAGDRPVVLSGGCFQNARLAESILAALPRSFMNHHVPPGDGGLALGQALIADAVARRAAPAHAEEIPACV